MSKNRKAKKTGNWAGKQNRDRYVKQARQQGLRARSAFKLEEIDKKYRLIRPGFAVVDLGATPGSWSQYVAGKVRSTGKVVAVDLLPMQEIRDVTFIQGDFTGQQTLDQLLLVVGESKLDLVLSDMAPNITGIRVTDQAGAELLQTAIFDFCTSTLKTGGKLLTKIFEGESAVVIRRMFEKKFNQVQIIKPDASRSESREIYLFAREFKGG